MDLGINGRVALVAASSKGLGKACALELAKEGARVCICARSSDELEAAAQAIRAATGATVLATPTDLTSQPEITALFDQIHSELGPVEILVANVGGPKLGTFDQLGDEDWTAAFELVHLSTIRLIREALTDMRARSWGRIIAIQSSSVKQPIEALTLSNGLRPGIAGLMKSLVAEVSSDNITVNTVLPGVILTERIISSQTARAEQHGRTYEEQIELFAQRIPLRRFGEPQDIGAIVAFVASERARYMTGSVVQVDGGMIQSVV
jgi:3-oxoacyl-[acyl-carrier protein] reductase